MSLFIFRLPLNVNMVTEDFAPRKKRFQAAFKH